MLKTKLQKEIVKATKHLPLIMNLQLFAEPAGASGEGAGDGTGGNPGTPEGEGKGGEGEKSFDDLLKDKTYQSEFDKRIAKALETAKAKWETEKATELQNAKTEAEKLAKMNADQKAEYEKQKKLDELTKREKDITTRELKAQAYETLAEKGLPKDLVEILNYSDAETCNKSIEAVEKAFQSAVEKAVNEKLRGNGAPKGGQGNNNNKDVTLAGALAEYYK